MNNEKLLPCPCCGGKASYGTGFSGGALSDKEYTFVNCVDCGISNSHQADMVVYDKEDAKEEWNRRVNRFPEFEEALNEYKYSRVPEMDAMPLHHEIMYRMFYDILKSIYLKNNKNE